MKFKIMLIVMLSLFSVNSFADLNDVVSLFKPENQQEVRNFILDKNQTKKEAVKNIIKILNKEVDGNYLKEVDRNGPSVEIDAKNTPFDIFDEYEKKSEALYEEAMNVKNSISEDVANQVSIEVGVAKAFHEADKEMSQQKR